MLLASKTVIIAGAGPGLGRQLALAAAREGARVALGARSSAMLEEIAAAVRDAGGEAVARATDVVDAAQCHALAAATLGAFGRIDGLINGAFRAAPVGSAVTTDLGEWMATMEVTCFGALRMVQAVAPAMRAQGGGAIVNVSSMAVLQAPAELGAYGTGKSALEGLTRQLAAELGRDGIRVNCARPGWMWGPTVAAHVAAEAAARGMVPEARQAEIATSIPLGRMPTDADCAGAVLMLLSDHARAVTGVTLDVNGGEVMTA